MIKDTDLAISRRHFMVGMGAITACCGVLGWPQLSFGAVPTNKRLMVVIQRGAMDGLGAVVPYKDPSYHGIRKSLAMPDTGMLDLDGYFAMNAAMKPLHTLYKNGEVVVVHAVASPYRSRSHFDAQDLLENGTPKPHGLTTGWLGRTLKAMNGTVEGLAVGPAIPLVLQGAGKNLQSWSPSTLPEADADFMMRVAHMYQRDEMLGMALEEAGNFKDTAAGGAMRGPRQFIEMMKTAATFMKKENGARIASIDIGGWDTHQNQGTDKGRLAQVLGILAEGIDGFRTGMGEEWNNTAVLVITEFGRTVAVNGTNGTDHGTGSAAFLVGGSVKGGRVVGEWPTLAAKNLYEERDLYPANDLRSLIKAVLEDHMGMESGVTEEIIFPDSRNAAPMKGLFAV